MPNQGEKVIDGVRDGGIYEQLTVSTNAAGYAPIKVPAAAGGALFGATACLIYVEGGAVRFRPDGIAPTATIGFPLDVSLPFFYTGDPSKLIFIRSGSVDAIVNFIHYP